MNNGYNFDIGRYVSEGIEIIKKDIGLYIGYTVVYFLIVIITAIIPLLGIIALFLIAAPLAAGFILGVHKSSRNEILEFGDFFKGFDYFAQLLVLQLIQGLIILVIMIPLLVIFGSSFYMIASGNIPDFSIGIVGILIVILVYAAMFFIYISYIFAPHFIIFGNMPAWEAMETSRKIAAKKFFPILGLVLILSIINLIGCLPCYLGLLFTLPATYAIIYAAFKDIVNLDNPEGEDNQGDAYNHLVD